MPDMTVDDIRGILVCKDLFFMGGVTATARSKGLAMKVCPGLSGLGPALSSCPGVRVVIVDMNLVDPTEPTQWAELRRLAPAPITLAGFGSHVDTRRFDAARTAGFDHVLANSAFSSRMVDWLEKWMR
jgi:hypothetical protein